jgi:hypothetical protein
MSQASALAPSGKSRALFRASRRLEEGRFAIVTNVGSGMRWTQWCRSARVAPTNDAKAYGEVVWSWRPDAGAKLCGMIHKATGARKPGPRGERDISRKTIAWGMPDVSGASAVNTRVHTPTTKRTRGCGCIGHPAFPAPSDLQKAGNSRSNLARNMRRDRETAFSVIARSTCDEAIHSFFGAAGMDCFAALAMTRIGLCRVFSCVGK